MCSCTHVPTVLALSSPSAIFKVSGGQSRLIPFTFPQGRPSRRIFAVLHRHRISSNALLTITYYHLLPNDFSIATATTVLPLQLPLGRRRPRPLLLLVLLQLNDHAGLQGSFPKGRCGSPARAHPQPSQGDTSSSGEFGWAVHFLWRFRVDVGQGAEFRKLSLDWAPLPFQLGQQESQVSGLGRLQSRRLGVWLGVGLVGKRGETVTLGMR